ncbi:hypothetical protein EV426DRAFT_676556 [Tirmania nivea]|nr:hypothetical protein EV426DRAFT_676556 [Tirmania nivea]
MSAAMMSISADTPHLRDMLFDLSKPVTVSPETFDNVWPYVDSVYTKLRSGLLQAYGTVRIQKYECRLRKSRTSSTVVAQDTNGKVIKRRHTSIRQYLLPCRHIFHLDTEAKVLTPLQWEAYIGMFAECGMEVYETVGTIWVEEERSGRNVERANIVIRVRESFEQVQQQLYTAYEMMDRLNMEDTVQSERMEEWANHVQATLSTLTSIRAEDIVNRHRPWEL